MNNQEPDTIYIDPQVKPILEQMATRMATREPFGTVSPELMRQRFKEDIAAWNENPPDVARVVDGCIEGPGGTLHYRLYDPVNNGEPAPCLLHFHGGGWIVGDYETNDLTMRMLANHSGVSILSADYRLAPEHKFPAALDDCVYVTRYVYQHADELGIDATRIGICGDSSGGNLTLATALSLRDADEHWLKYLLLIYPPLTPDADDWSNRVLGKGDYGLGSQAMEFFWSSYLEDKSERTNPLAAPLLADLSRLPPTTIISGGLDALQCDSFALEDRFKAANVEHLHRFYPGMIHGFFSMSNFLDVAKNAVEEAAADVAQYLGDPGVTENR